VAGRSGTQKGNGQGKWISFSLFSFRFFDADLLYRLGKWQKGKLSFYSTVYWGMEKGGIPKWKGLAAHLAHLAQQKVPL